jgi:hypothetical protein
MAGHLLGVLEPSVVLQVNRDAAIIYCALWRPCVAFQQFLSGVFLVEAQPPPGRVLPPDLDSASPAPGGRFEGLWR